MNVVIFQLNIVNPNDGGISRMSKTYFDFLASQGYNVFFLSFSKSIGELLPKQLLITGDTREEQHSSFNDIIDKYDINVMIYQDGISPYQNYVLQWAKSKQVKIIDVIHSTLRGMYGVDGHVSLSKIKPNILKWGINKCVNYYFMMKYGKYYREQFELSDKVVLLSDKFRDEITYFTGWKDLSKFTAISNPLTLNPPTKINTNKNKTVLHVALFNEQKRQDLLLDMWKYVENLQPDWILKIVGDGYMRPKLEAKMKTLQLKHVEFLGYQSPQPYYDEAAIFCLTSAFESFGLVLVESMAYGCVPLAFNSFETAADIIDNGKNGFLIQPFDVRQYAKQVLKLMDDIQLRKKMAVFSVEKSKNFMIEKIMPSWVEIIDDLYKV